jgi:cell fate regulator YaaT (PSP1 superfamily)
VPGGKEVDLQPSQFVDMSNATRFCWIHLLITKDTVEVLSAIKQIKAQAQLEMEEKIVFVRADNGKSEFSLGFQDYCKVVGIRFEPTPPYKHSMNGVVERYMAIYNSGG